MNIVVLDGRTTNPGDLSWDGLKSLGTVTIYDQTETDQVEQRIAHADAVFTNKTELTAEHMDAAPKMKFIGVLATGYNVVDVAAARSRGIVVSNIPDYGTTAVAQFTFALLLELCHRVAHHNARVQDGEWARRKAFCFWDYPLIELKGKTIGIIGYGRIGKAVAQIAEAFGMNVVAHSPRSTDDVIVPLDQLLAESDVISLHCPLTPETKGIINASSIQKMKDGVLLLNTSRGQLIDESALRDALVSGKVYAAAVDVVSSEPVREDNPLLGLDNCLITPHIAWAPKESRQRLLDIAVQNLRQFIRGVPINTV